MTYTNGIPPVSDYSHWNEDAQRVWYEENKYDMEHPEVFEDYQRDWFEDDFGPYEEDIPEDKCWELNRHNLNTSGWPFLFGPNADIFADTNLVCDDCGFELASNWTPEGYSVTGERMIVYREMFTAIGRKHLIAYDGYYPVYEKVR